MGLFNDLMVQGRKLFLSLEVQLLMGVKRLPTGNNSDRWYARLVESLRVDWALERQWELERYFGWT